MIKAILSDFSETILFPKHKEDYHNLNGLHHRLVKEMGEYNAWDYFIINKELLNFFATLSEKFNLYLFTSDAVQNQPQINMELKKVFKEIISAKENGINKQTPEAYIFIAKKINLLPSEILFIDDREVNLEPAAKAGFKVLQYIDNHNLIKDLSSL